MPFNNSIGNAVDGDFTCHPAYAANDSTRPLRYSITGDGWVSLAGWIRRIGATATIADGARFGVGYLNSEAFPLGKGYEDLICRTSGGIIGVSIIVANEVIGSETWPRGSLICTNQLGRDLILVQNAGWISFSGIGYRIS